MYERLMLVAALGMFVSAPARAETPGEIARLFPYQASVNASKLSGLTRLLLPSRVLERTRADLSDLRILDASGAEVPFLIDDARRPVEERDVVTERVPAIARSVERTSSARPGLVPLRHELFRVKIPEKPASGEGWDLVFDSRVADFVRSVEVRRAGSAAPIARGNVYRLQAPWRERLHVELPPALPSEIAVVIDGEGSYLEPTLAFESSRRPEKRRELAIDLAELSRRHEHGTTFLTVSRAGGIVPSRLRIVSSTPDFNRPIEVRDGGAHGGDRSIASGSVIRVATLPDVSLSELIFNKPPESDRLRIEIRDGDSPELAELHVFGIVDQPSLVFASGGERTLYFGGGRARGPGYDLQRFQATPAGARVLEQSSADEVELGPIRENPGFDPKPALGFLMKPGPAIDARQFTHRRRVLVDDAPEGLSRIRLSPNELAHLRDDLGDLRIGDGDFRQWPYLVERDGVTLPVSLRFSSPRVEHGESHFALDLPEAPLALDRIALFSPAQYVDRAATLHVVSDTGQDLVVFQGRLGRRPGETEPLALEFPRARVASLELVIDDGSDAPLPIEKIEARVQSADVFVAAPPGEYWLLAGNRELEAPRYELGRARDLVLIVPSGTIRDDSLDPNPSYRRSLGPRAPEIALWISLVLAAGALGALTLRAVRREPADQRS